MSLVPDFWLAVMTALDNSMTPDVLAVIGLPLINFDCCRPATGIIKRLPLTAKTPERLSVSGGLYAKVLFALSIDSRALSGLFGSVTDTTINRQLRIC
jgi:hypothetical protein